MSVKNNKNLHKQRGILHKSKAKAAAPSCNSLDKAESCGIIMADFRQASFIIRGPRSACYFLPDTRAAVLPKVEAPPGKKPPNQAENDSAISGPGLRAAAGTESEEIEMKRLLLIMNPTSGTKKANPHLPEILSIFSRAGYACMTFMTQKRGDATELAAEFAGDSDLLVCIGGDGTFNEVISGLVRSGAKTPVGYIPAGSTNDFASSLGLPKNVLQAAQAIVAGNAVAYDVGRFRDRYFTYVASFGAFTKTSYATPQNVKNVLGHLAYVLGGIRELSSLHRYHVALSLDDGLREEGDYIFGAISNSTSVGGILTLDPEIVDMNDGRFELLLVRYPSGMGELAEIIRSLSVQHYDSPALIFRSARKLTVEADPGMDWTLDGEFAPGSPSIEIENLHSAINIVIDNGFNGQL